MNHPFKMVKTAFILSLSALSLVATPTLAIVDLGDIRDTATDTLSNFDAGQQEKLMQEKQAKLFPRKTRLVAKKSNLPPPSVKIEQGDKIHFVLNGIIWHGSTIYTRQQLDAIVAPYIGKSISLNTLQSLVDLVDVKYREDGYILSQAILPPQLIRTDGIVRIEIIEGYISQVNIVGKTGLAQIFIKKYMNNVLKSRPLNQTVLERNLLLTDDIPGLHIKSVITPAKSVPDSADLSLYTERHWVNAYAAYDNYGTRYLGPQELSYGVTLNSLLLPGDSNAFHFMTTSHHKEVQYAEFVHHQPLGGKGFKLDLGTNYTQTQPGFVLSNFDTISRSASLYANFIYSLIRLRDQNLDLSLQANYQNVTSTILGFPFYQDRFRTLALAGAYNGLDRWNGYNTFTLSLMQGFPIWGANEHFYQSRANGQSRFTLATFNASHIHPLPHHLSLYLAAEGQYSCNVLLATEQFGFGGPIYGRGYDPYEISGDRGVAAKGELRLQFFPNLQALSAIQFYVFYDAGMVWNLQTFGLPGRQDATSTGAGVRIQFTSHLDGEAYIAKPLTIPVAALLAIPANGNQARSFFQIIARI